MCVSLCGALAANAVVRAPASTSAMLGWQVIVIRHVVDPNHSCALVYVTKLPGRIVAIVQNFGHSIGEKGTCRNRRLNIAGVCLCCDAGGVCTVVYFGR